MYTYIHNHIHAYTYIHIYICIHTLPSKSVLHQLPRDHRTIDEDGSLRIERGSGCNKRGSVPIDPTYIRIGVED
jgi:hypothetical protein